MKIVYLFNYGAEFFFLRPFQVYSISRIQNVTSHFPKKLSVIFPFCDAWHWQHPDFLGYIFWLKAVLPSPSFRTVAINRFVVSFHAYISYEEILSETELVRS
jgi:hypothetical protein